ncbi:MAG: hypothetical protein R2828_02715 [Saprospiraceae bacterium]
MNKFLLLAFSILFSLPLSGQINIQDSSVQVIGYWGKNEQQTYAFSYVKYSVTGSDTTSKTVMTYEVDVTIKDSTAHSYTIEWFYKNYAIETQDELVRKIASMGKDVSVLIKTDEFGAILEVLNWEEVRDYITNATEVIKKDIAGIPAAEAIMAQNLSTYSSKQGIESNAIKDAQQFYTFHGGKYVMGTNYTGQMQLANNYGGAPFDVDLTVNLDEINEEDGNAIIRMYQNVNAEQLTNATYDYLKKVGILGNQLPTRDEFPPLTNEIWTASRIHSASGWPIYSIETREVVSEGATAIEERIIEIK